VSVETLLKLLHAPLPPEDEWEPHAQKLDAALGIDVQACEREILEREPCSASERAAWRGLPPHVLLTPYCELAQAVEECGLEREAHWVDLGAAYARLGHVLGELRSQARFTGIELVLERAKEGERALRARGLTRARVVQADLESCDIPEGDVYFLYDFGALSGIRRVLSALQAHARQRPLRIVARGRFTQHEIERAHPWLSKVVKPLRHPKYSVYFTHV
jgi:hypothetical protein